MPIRASAPGSLMLLGEYAVLYGKPAIVCAVDKRISVTLTPRNDEHIHIHTSLYGSYITSLSQLTIEKPFHFVLGALSHLQPKMRKGCDLHIETHFSDQIGLGSSAAVTVATLAALVSWLGIKVLPLDLVRMGRQVVRTIQGNGSGADIAASVHGGIVAYQAQPISAEKFPVIHPLTALYCGYKTPTPQVIQKVQSSFGAHPKLLQSIMQSIGQCAAEGMLLIRKEKWQDFGNIMNIQQGLMTALGVNDLLLQQMVEELCKQPDVLGAKISGSGLGDCVIGLGPMSFPIHLSNQFEAKVEHIPLAMTLQGVQCEKI